MMNKIQEINIEEVNVPGLLVQSSFSECTTPANHDIGSLTIRFFFLVWYPHGSGLPYYCTPPVCVPAVLSALAVWRLSKKK